MEILVERSISSLVVEDPQIALINSESLELGGKRSDLMLTDPDIKSIICVPLISSNVFYGALTFGHSTYEY